MAVINGSNISYPFNPYGTDAACIIRNELHTLTPENGKDYVVVVPRCGPFFRSTVVAANVSTGASLTENSGYTVGNLFNELSQQTNKGLFGTLVFTKVTAPIQVRLQYATLGGDFVLNDTEYASAVVNIMTNPRSIFWEQLVGTPSTYPPIDHTHIADDTLNYQGYLDAFTVALAQFKNQLDVYLGTTTDHIDAEGNVHKLSKADLLLQNVPNYPAATLSDIPSNAADRLMTLTTSKALYMYLFGGLTGSALSSAVVGEVQTTKSVVELLSVFETAGLMTTAELLNAKEWKVYLANLYIKAFNGTATTITAPAKNGVYSRLLGG